MSESKIVLALEQFKRDYAWDISLVNPNVTVTLRPDPLVVRAEHESNYLEEFINASKSSE